MQRNILRSLVIAAATTGALCTAGPAAASSIVYAKSSNVYLTSPDGTKGYALTAGGGWSSPSQADDGTIVAVHGQDIVRLDRSGSRCPIGRAASRPTRGGRVCVCRGWRRGRTEAAARIEQHSPQARVRAGE
jgi:hypothetical protein